MLSKIKIISKIYKSKSVGFEGDDFLNQVIVCEVNSNLNQTYLQLKTIEKEKVVAEKLNGRLAMLGIIAGLGAYLTTGQIIPGFV